MKNSITTRNWVCNVFENLDGLKLKIFDYGKRAQEKWGGFEDEYRTVLKELYAG